VNVSARQLAAGSFARDVEGYLAAAGLVASSLCLELTESTLLEAGRQTAQTIDDLKALGVLLALDDFGTGYSSLTYLKRFPLDYLKIDRSFVDGLGSDPADTAIVRAVVALSQALGLHTVAEGVETEAQLMALRALGCDMAQGYYFSRAVPDQDFVALLESTPRW
jgi:EAL domain-containing protein (putative c-di-GMP-specific phosphodiesterase class I)